MKKFLLMFFCLFALCVNAQTNSDSKVYDQQSIEGIWATYQAYDQHKKKWKDIGEVLCFAFTKFSIGGQNIVIIKTKDSDYLKLPYSIKNNTIQIGNDIATPITIKILSITEGKDMIGLLSIDPKSPGAIFKFLYVEE